MPQDFTEEDLDEARIEIARLRATQAELVAALRSLANLACVTPRPPQQFALCRTLLDIEGIARAAIARAESES